MNGFVKLFEYIENGDFRKFSIKEKLKLVLKK